MQTNNITDHEYTIGMMVFLVAYSIFEAPSNIALKLVQPHRWLGFLVVAFGAFCTGIGFSHTFNELAVLRFFLGAAEAGVFPGMSALIVRLVVSYVDCQRDDLLLHLLV